MYGDGIAQNTRLKGLCEKHGHSHAAHVVETHSTPGVVREGQATAHRGQLLSFVTNLELSPTDKPPRDGTYRLKSLGRESNTPGGSDVSRLSSSVLLGVVQRKTR